MEVERRTLKGIQRTQGKDNESTSSFFTKKRGKIQSGDGHIRTCYWSGVIPRIRWEMETDSVFIKDDATSRKKL